MTRFALFLIVSLLAGILSLNVESAFARPGSGAPLGAGYSHAPRHHRDAQRHRRTLPPEIAYRDPRVALRSRGRPDFLIHGYLPRLTERPIYNEPPPRFPER